MINLVITSISFYLPVQASLWPILISFTLFSFLFNVVMWMNFLSSVTSVLLNFLVLLFLMFLWWKDLSRESLLGYHTHKLEISLRFGMLLFILSEIFFFLSFFWAFYDASLAPSVELGMVWPPKGIQVLPVYSVPLLNTLILLTSGVTVTWAHHSLMQNYFLNTSISLNLTVLLGSIFLVLQWLEYSEAQFTISDGIYGSTFFMSTGFHGMHVLIGTTFLMVVSFQLLKGMLLFNHHFSFEAAAWYWHFVDVVWLFLYLNIYWWGSL